MFNRLDLSKEVLRGIESLQYTEMTKIQAAAIPLILEGHDIIGKSSTGTGKTAAFGIPAVESIQDVNPKKPQILVLAPTRELAMQISEEMRKYAKYKPGVGIATIYGGQSMDIQIRQLKRAAIVVGTPGRIMDHMRRKTLKLEELNMVILDEADEMLNMGFYEDIKTILQEAPAERQTLLFSATMPPAIMEIAGEFQNSPRIVSVDQGQKTLDTISQYYYDVPMGRKIETLKLLLTMDRPSRSLIFCNTKKMVDELAEELQRAGFRCAGLHGDMRQNARNQVLQEFKDSKIQLLIATDVAARGIDVDNVESVYNYDIPLDFEYYIHRIGRTGRAGRSGNSYTLISARRQLYKLRELARYLKCEIKQKQIPTRNMVWKQQKADFLEKVTAGAEALENHPDAAGLRALATELASLDYEALDLIAVLLHMVAKEDKAVETILKPIPAEEKPQERPRSSRKACLKLNAGRMQNMAPNFIVGTIIEETGLPKKAIGKINIYGDYSTVEMSQNDAETVLSAMQDCRIKNHKVHFSLRKEQNGKSGGTRDSRNNYKKNNAFAGRKNSGEQGKFSNHSIKNKSLLIHNGTM